MSDKPNVRFVDSHAEGDGGHDNDSFIPEKQRLMGRTQLCTQASVIGIGVEALLTEPGGDVFGLVAGQAVYNARITLMLRLQKLQQLLPRVMFYADSVTDVRAIKTGNEFLCVV